MEKSSVYQMIIERGIEQGIAQGVEQGKQLGAKEFAIAHILNLLNRRFSVSLAPTLMSELEAIDDLQRLSQLMDAAVEAERVENFIRALQTSGNQV